MNKNALEFAIFCIEEVALKLHLPGNLVYDMLAKKSDLLDTYLIPSCDVLHSQSRNYIVDDIILLLKERGIVS